MPFWTWDPASEIEALRQEMTRAFESAGLDTGHQGRTRASFLPGVHARAYPRLNVGEDAERFYIEALAPGVAPGTLEITVEKNTIRIAGQKRGAANDLVFPDANDEPSLTAEASIIAAITTTVPFDLVFPISGQLAAPQREAPAMPVVAVDEDRHFRADENDIGLPW